MRLRKEKDSLGEKKVPAESYQGIFTFRAQENFALSESKPSAELMRALGAIKLACARTNASLGLLEEKKARAIARASKEFARGKFAKEFSLDYFQAGAGTPFNMNANEIIANRATELIGGKKGSYWVNANNDVNMSQSSNDVIPTAARLVLLMKSARLTEELKKTSKAFRKKSLEFRGILKCGRTHYMDAVPITLGQEFSSYTSLTDSSLERISLALEGLKTVPLGGTAVGTGINTHPKFRKKAIRELSKESGFKLNAPKNPFEPMHSMNCLVDYSNALRCLAISLHKISSDLMFLSSGPDAGAGEIILPAVEPGSSIMPGKINPSIPEAAKMACFYVQGIDHVVENAALSGHLEINVFVPVILFSLEQATALLSNTLKMMRTKCITGIKADREKCLQMLESSYSYATALNPYLGYSAVAELVKEASRRRKPVKEVILEKNFISKKDLDALLSLKKMTKPQKFDKALAKKIQENKNFKKFLRSIR